jgi:uncharacterized protein
MILNERPLREGWWTVPSSIEEKPKLIGSKCTICHEIHFPKKAINVCPQCHSRNCLVDVQISGSGKISTFGIANQPPTGGFYKGVVPYAYGCIDLDEGVRVEAQIFHTDLNQITIGMNVDLIIDQLYENTDGIKIQVYKFKPI